jgi:uncharacterized protein (TIGR02268 family)
LDRDSLVVDKTRFKLAEVSDQVLILQPFADLGSGERLVARVNFKDRAVPAQATFVITTHPTEVDGTVEIDRRANTPEALIAALAERDAQVEDLKARCEMSGPIGVVRAGLQVGLPRQISLRVQTLSENKDSLEVLSGNGNEGKTWMVSTVLLRNPQGQKPWILGPPALLLQDGTPVRVRSVWMEKPQLGPGEQGLLMMETEPTLRAAGSTLRLELPDRESTRRLSALFARERSPRP